MINSWTEKLGNGDHTFFSIPWRESFFSDEVGNCFCGGIGVECNAILLKHKDEIDPNIPKFAPKEIIGIAKK